MITTKHLTLTQQWIRNLYCLSRVLAPKKKFDPTVFALNDVTTPSIFDNSYCRNLQKGMGLLATDQMLILNPMTGDYVKKMAENQNVFFDSFVSAMIKSGSIGVQEGWRDYTGLRFFQWLSG